MARVVVLSDDAESLSILRATLEEGGHEVVVCEITQAMAPCADTETDAVILDLSADKPDLWQMLEELRNDPRTEQLPIVVLSQKADVNSRVTFIRAGAADFLAKPFYPEELLARIESQVSRHLTRITGLHGRLSAYPITDLLQNLEMNQKSGTLEVFAHNETGRIILRSGKLLDADYRHLYGADAVVVIAQLDEGTFSFLPSRVMEGAADDILDLRSIQNILMDASWVSDELQRLADQMPADHSPLCLKGAMSDVAEETDDLPLHAVAAFLLHNPASSVEMILAQNLAAPSKIRLAVAQLIEKELVGPAA